MCDGGFEIPVNHRERGQVEHGVRNHQHENVARHGEDRSEGEPGDQCLFDAGNSLECVMGQRKSHGSDQDD